MRSDIAVLHLLGLAFNRSKRYFSESGDQRPRHANELAYRLMRTSIAGTSSLGYNAGVNIETTRLILRRPALADVPTLFEFLGDAGAMRYTHIDKTFRACRRRVAVHEWCRRRDGYAPWTVVTKTDARIVGWGGLYNDPFEPGWGAEVGYFFHPAAWGQGYATELVAACIDVADNILQLPEVSAFARPANSGSRRVLEKTGFEVVRFVSEMDRFLYRRARSVISGPNQASRINPYPLFAVGTPISECPPRRS